MRARVLFLSPCLCLCLCLCISLSLALSLSCSFSSLLLSLLLSLSLLSVYLSEYPFSLLSLFLALFFDLFLLLSPRAVVHLCAARRLTRAARWCVKKQSLGRTNLRQAEEIASLKDKVYALENHLVHLQPLEALLAYMQQSSDSTVLALLAADSEPPPTAGAPTLPPSEVMERLVTLLQTCGEGVDDLGPDILQSEAQACDMAAAGDEGWMDAIASAERQHQGEQERADEKLNGGRRVRRPRASGGDDQEGNKADDWMGFPDGEDAFEAEIAAVGTHLHQVCQKCGAVYTETTNSDWACRFHPGTKKVDAAWNSVWNCCGLKHAMKGCKVTRHVPSLADDAEPDAESERS